MNSEFVRVNKITIILVALLLPVSAYANVQIDFGMWLRNLETHLPHIVRLLVASSYVMGVFFMIAGIMKLSQYGKSTVFNMSQNSLAGPLMYLAVGSGLFYFPSMVDTTLQTFWQYGTNQVMPYFSAGDVGFSSFLHPVVAIVRVIGYIAFLRGWTLLVRIGGQGGQPVFSKAALHIIGGIMAINIVGTWQMITNTLNYAMR